MPRALIVVTNHAHFEGTDRATGAWFPELAHFHTAMAEAAIAVDYVSPQGGFIPLDPDSLSATHMDALSWQYYDDADYRQQYLAHSLAPIQIDPTAYDILCFAGGQGVMWDFPNNQTLGHLAQAIAEQGGIIAAIGHGVVGLLAMGTFVQGKRLTGNAFDEEPLKGAGATFITSPEPVVIDHRLVTGQDSQSAQRVGEAAITLLQDH